MEHASGERLPVAPSPAASPRPSLRAVAEAAGVGIGTASRTLTGRGYVGEETRERVLTAARRLGYRPNRLASGLRSDSSHLIALILPDLTNEFYAVSSQVIHARLREAGYQLLVAAAGTAEEEREIVESFIEYRVDGIIHVPTSVDSHFDAPCPVVELNRRSNSAESMSVVCDDAAGFRALTASVLEAGHRDLALIAGEESFSTTRDRIAGFRQALDAAGSGDVHPRVLCGAYTPQWGHDACLELLTDPAVRPSAIIAASPRIATGVALALTERDVVVPRDMGLASYSAPEWFAFWGGGVQTFLPPLREMAWTAVDMMLACLSDPTSRPAPVVLTGTLRRGGSLGAPRQGQRATTLSVRD